MKTIMKLDELKTISQLRDFLAGTQPVAFSISGNKDDRYRGIQRELVRFRYLGLCRADKRGSWGRADPGVQVVYRACARQSLEERGSRGLVPCICMNQDPEDC